MKNMKDNKYNLMIGSSHVIATTMARTASDARKTFLARQGREIVNMHGISVKRVWGEVP
jgi:hypothetical protein